MGIEKKRFTASCPCSSVLRSIPACVLRDAVPAANTSSTSSLLINRPAPTANNAIAAT